jgi:hypothetical protein
VVAAAAAAAAAAAPTGFVHPELDRGLDVVEVVEVPHADDVVPGSAAARACTARKHATTQECRALGE